MKAKRPAGFHVATDFAGDVGLYYESHNHDSLGDRVAWLDKSRTITGWRLHLTALVRAEDRLPSPRRDRIRAMHRLLAAEHGVRLCGVPRLGIQVDGQAAT